MIDEDEEVATEARVAFVKLDTPTDVSSTSGLADRLVTLRRLRASRQEPRTRHDAAGRRSVMDLATAIVELGRAAEQRRAGRRHLVQATEAVAAAVVEHARTGDEVSVSRGDGPGIVRYRVVRVTWPVSQWAGHPGADHPEGDATLVREDAALLDVRDGWWDGSDVHGVVGRTIYTWAPDCYVEREPDLHLATAEERLAFAREAEAVVAGLAAEHRDEAVAYDDGADLVARVVPR